MISLQHNYNLSKELSELLNVKSCKLTDYLDNFVLYTSTEKNSESDSYIISAKIKKELFKKYVNDSIEIIIKLTFKYKNIIDNGLEVEEQIYKNIIQKLLYNNNTPHLISYITSYKCTDTLEYIFGREISNKIETEIINLEDIYDISKKNILITLKSNGKTFENWLINQKYDIQDLLSIIFQVLYTIYCFNLINLRHNDLHFRNIFIDELPDYTTIYYKNTCVMEPCDTYVTLRTRYVARIYDFDRSSSYFNPAIERNLLIDRILCPDDVCNGINYKYDTYVFISTFILYKDIYISSNTMLILTNNFFSKIIDMNWVNKINSKYLENGYIPSDLELKSTIDCINILIEQDWKSIINLDAPFKIYPGIVPKSVPKHLIYEIPSKTNVTYWNPRSVETHMPLQISSIDENMDDKLFLKIFNIIMKKFDNELSKINYDFTTYKNNILKLINELIINKGKTNNYYYSIAFAILLNPIYYQFKENTSIFFKVTTVKKTYKVYEPIIIEHVSDIWNICNNILPISIPSI